MLPSAQYAGSIPEFLKSMEGEKVCVVIIMGTALIIVVGRAAGSDEVVAVELPIHILEAMLCDLGMMQQDAAHLPFPEASAVR
jgi:hypothetical protein